VTLRAAAGNIVGGKPTNLGARHYWHADTWYYPLDLNRRQAVAITFRENQFMSIERVAGPAHSAPIERTE